MKIILIFLFSFFFFMKSAHSQENLEPYEKYDSLQRACKQSLLIESGSFTNASFSTDAVYLVNLDNPSYVLKYDENGYSQSMVNSEKKSLKKYIKKLAALPDYKCPSEIRARDKKWLKAKDYNRYWKYRLVGESKNGEGRVKRPLVNDCMSLFATIKERKAIKRILRQLEQLPVSELTSTK